MDNDSLNRTIGVAYVCAFTFLSVLLYLVKLAFKLSTRESGSTRSTSRLHILSSWIKTQLLYAPIFKHRKARTVTIMHGKINFGSLPSRLQGLFIFLIFSTNVFLILWRQPYSKTESSLLASFNRRLGAIAIANFIPIVATSNMQNPLIYLLDIPYNSFILLHRWLARIAALEIIAHVLCHTVFVGNKYGWSEAGKQLTSIDFFTYGLAAAVLFTTLLLISIKPIRSLAYDAFHYIHIAILIAAFSLVWIHLSHLPQKWFLLAAVILWAVVRIAGFLTMIYRSYGARSCIVYLEELPQNATRVTIQVPRKWKFEAGQSLNLMIPEIDCSGAHPFSVAWSDLHDISEPKSLQLGEQTNDKLPVRGNNGLDSSESNSETKQFLHCIIKEQSGMTQKLNEHARVAAEKGNLKNRVYRAFVSGPHGKQQDVSGYDDMLLVAGGVGITHQISYLHDLLEKHLDGELAPSRVRLLWIAPNSDVLQWVKPYLQSIKDLRHSSKSKIGLDLFVTKQPGLSLPQNAEGFEIHHGRPDLSKAVGEQVNQDLSKRIFVSVCGPGNLADDLRQCVREALSAGANLDFHEEGFGW